MTTVTGQVPGPGAAQPATPNAGLPYRVGKVTRGWLWVIIVAGIIGAIGFIYWVRELNEGLSVTNMRDIGSQGGAAWGLYIAFLVYFVGVSFAGIFTAAIIRLLRITSLRPIARAAEVMTVVSLCLGVTLIIADLGVPLRGAFNLLKYARPQSPFFATFTLVISGYLFASLVYLYLDGRADAAECAQVPGRLQRFHRRWAAGWQGTRQDHERHDHASLWLAIAILPLLVVAHSTLGFVFGIQTGRPGWFSALQAPGFVVLAAVSGVGMLLVIAPIIQRAVGTEKLYSDKFYPWLGRFLMVLIIAYLYFMISEILTAAYAGQERESGVAQAFMTGRYAWLFWLSVALLVLSLVALVWQAVKRHWSVWLLVAAGVGVNLAAMGKRFLIVVPSQTSGMLLPYQKGTYTPTFSEYAVVIGLFGLGVVAIAAFMKIFPIVSGPKEYEAEEPAASVAGEGEN